MPQLTEAQQKVWKFASESQRTRRPGAPSPSVDEIAVAVGIGKTTAAVAVRVLDALGKVRRDPHARRSLWVIELFPKERTKKSA
jgi:hypothetical protein